MGVNAVSCLLLLIISPMPWWGVLNLSWVICPVPLGLQRPLVRGLGQAFRRHRAEVQMAVSARLVDATPAVGLAAGTQRPALITALLGVLAWTAVSMVFHTSIRSRAERQTGTGRYR